MKKRVVYCTNKKISDICDIVKYLELYCNVIKVIESKDDLFSIVELSFDLMISDRADYIFPNEICKKYYGKLINTHPSLLPNYRGSYPMFWCVLNNHPYGCSLHLIDEGIDTGDVVMQRIIEYNEHETFRDLYIKTRKVILSLIVDYLLDKDMQITSNTVFFDKELKKKDFNNVLEKLPNGWDTTLISARKILF